MVSKRMVGVFASVFVAASVAKEDEQPNPLATRQECNSEDGHIWLYGDLDQVEVSSPEECCALCESTPDCAKWSFAYAGKLLNKCLLRGPSAFSEKRQGILSGMSSATKHSIELATRKKNRSFMKRFRRKTPLSPSAQTLAGSLFVKWPSSADGGNDLSMDDVLDYFSSFGSVLGADKLKDSKAGNNLVRLDFEKTIATGVSAGREIAKTPSLKAAEEELAALSAAIESKKAEIAGAVAAHEFGKMANLAAEAEALAAKRPLCEERLSAALEKARSPIEIILQHPEHLVVRTDDGKRIAVHVYTKRR